MDAKPYTDHEIKVARDWILGHGVSERCVIPWEVAPRVVATVDALRAEVAALRDERDEWRRKQQHSREQNHALNERAQRAEGIIAKSGIVEGRPQGANGRSIGRALANYAAAQYRRERDEARDRVRGLEALLREVREHYPSAYGQDATHPYVVALCAKIDAALAARSEPCDLAPPEEPDCRGHDHSATAPHDCGGS